MLVRLRSISAGTVALASGPVWAGFAAWLFAGHGWGTIAAVRTACGAAPPDARFAPSPTTTLAFLDGCRNGAGLAAYRHLQLLDLAYPAVVALFLAGTLLALARWRSRPALLAVLPVAASACDYLENVAAWALIAGSQGARTAQLLQAASLGKNVLSWAAWLAVAAVLALRLRARRRRRPTARADSPGPLADAP